MNRIVLHGLSYREASDFGLVLDSAGIEFEARHIGRGWVILVPETHAEAAREVVAHYREENRPAPSMRPRLDIRFRTSTGYTAALVLLAFHMATGGGLGGLASAGAARSELLLAGEWWRAVTALTLHADGAHLVSNMAGLGVFGSYVCHFTGWGLGWLMVLVSGALGNVLNALAHQSGHSSIGASTAVFGAVGLIGGYRLMHGLGLGPGWRRVVVPLAAALALLAMLGSDQATDVGAHFFGWLAGTGLGLGYGLLPDDRILALGGSRIVQAAGVAAALGLLALAWGLAVG